MKTTDGRDYVISEDGTIWLQDKDKQGFTATGRIVFCKSCSFYNRQSQPEGYGICQVLGRMMKDGEFCCYGKERTDAD